MNLSTRLTAAVLVSSLGIVSPVADGVLCGFGGQGYELALEALHKILTAKKG